MTEYRTPGGHVVRMEVREGTNDDMVCRSVIVEDEYGLAGLDLTGTALDIGAHIGAASVLLATEYPGLQVIAVEPVPENVALLRRNFALNGLDLIVLDGAVGRGPQTIHYNWRGSEMADMHRYIGNQHFAPGTPHDSIKVRGYTLSALVRMAGGRVSLMKIDAEGAERDFLRGPALAKVDRIHGEWHHGPAVELRRTTGKALLA